MISSAVTLLKTFPTLYKKTSTGAIQFWDLSVNEVQSETGPIGEIVTTYGQHGTPRPPNNLRHHF